MDSKEVQNKRIMKALKSPCSGCPFLKTATKGWLGKRRMKEICDSTVSGDEYFSCHKTTEEGGARGGITKERLCAGKLILESKANPNGNKSTRMVMMFGHLNADYSDLRGAADVFDTIQEAINHHTH